MAGGKAAPAVPPRLPLVTLLSRHRWSRVLGVIPQLGVGSASALFVTQHRGILSFMLLTWYYCGLQRHQWESLSTGRNCLVKMNVVSNNIF